MPKHARTNSTRAGASAPNNDILPTVLNNLTGELQHLTRIIKTVEWFPQTGSDSARPALIRQTPAEPLPPSYQSALDTLGYGVQLLEQSSDQLLQVQFPPLRQKHIRKPRAPSTKKLTTSPFFPSKTSPPSPTNPSPKKPKSTPKSSPHFQLDPFSIHPTPPGLPFPLSPPGYGLIQERIQSSLYALVIQSILWNQTTATAARPILFTLLCTYPTPSALAVADPDELLNILHPLGLQQIRTARLINLAKIWVASPPHPSRRYARRNYPNEGDNTDIPNNSLLEESDFRPGWEIAHLPGIGAYALDSFRMFGRDRLRGVREGSGEEPEWKRVLPRDKDLRAWLRWRWGVEGWVWDAESGQRRRRGV